MQPVETALGSRIHTALESIDPILLDTTDAADTAPPATLNSIIEHASPARPAPATDDQAAICDYSATGMAAVYNAAPPVHHACALGPAANARCSTLPSGMMSMDKCCTAQQPHHGFVPSACSRWAHDHLTAYHRPTCCASGAWRLPARSVCQDMLNQAQIYRNTASGVLGGTAAYGFGSAYNTAIEEAVDYASDTSTLNDSALYAFADEVGSLPVPAVIGGLTGMEPGKPLFALCQRSLPANTGRAQCRVDAHAQCSLVRCADVDVARVPARLCSKRASGHMFLASRYHTWAQQDVRSDVTLWLLLKFSIRS